VGNCVQTTFRSRHGSDEEKSKAILDYAETGELSFIRETAG